MILGFIKILIKSFIQFIPYLIVIGIMIGVPIAINKFVIKEKFENCIIRKDKNPDDLFTDNLDHPLGIKKQNRHHSF